MPYVYNALKTLRWKGVHDAIWRDEEVKCVHYILSPKPWDEDEAEKKREDRDGLHAWWWRVNEERQREEKEKGGSTGGVLDDGF